LAKEAPEEELQFDQFHLTFGALGKDFDLVVFGRVPTGEPHGPECYTPGKEPAAAPDRLFMRRYDGLLCRQASGSLSYPFRPTTPVSKQGGRLHLRDGEWWGSIQTDEELYVVRPRSLYDGYASLGTVVVYRYSDADDF
jgi:hypothetical protein